MRNWQLIIITLFLTSYYVSHETYNETNEYIYVEDEHKDPDLIRDCPEQKIINAMPGNRSIYDIYKGQKRAIREFDTEWVKAFCKVKTTKLY